MANDRLIAAINIAAKDVTEALDERLRPLGLTASNYYFILKLADRAELTQEQLYKRIHLSPSNVTRRLAQLISAGFVTKQRSATDGRTWQLSLTAQGRAVLPGLTAALDATNQQVFGRLTADEQVRLGTLLTKLFA